MGIGPWAQADLMRGIERSERARFRRAVQVELSKLERDKRVLLPDNEMIAMLERIKSKVTPTKREPKAKRLARIGGKPVSVFEAAAAPSRSFVPR